MFTSGSTGIVKSFAAITPHLKFKTGQVAIDNLAFKCHYRATFMLLLVATVLVTSRYGTFTFWSVIIWLNAATQFKICFLFNDSIEKHK